MINEEWEKNTKMMPLLSPFTPCAFTFFLPDEMAYVPIAGLQWFILTHRVSQACDSHSKAPPDPNSKQLQRNNEMCLDWLSCS